MVAKNLMCYNDDPESPARKEYLRVQMQNNQFLQDIMIKAAKTPKTWKQKLTKPQPIPLHRRAIQNLMQEKVKELRKSYNILLKVIELSNKPVYKLITDMRHEMRKEIKNRTYVLNALLRKIQRAKIKKRKISSFKEMFISSKCPFHPYYDGSYGVFGSDLKCPIHPKMQDLQFYIDQGKLAVAKSSKQVPRIPLENKEKKQLENKEENFTITKCLGMFGAAIQKAFTKPSK